MKKYSNVGEHLQTLADVISVLIIIVGVILGISITSNAGGDGFIVLILIVAVFALIAYLSTIILRAFGALVQSNINIEKKLNEILESLSNANDDFED